jgi:hypothetical protein
VCRISNFNMVILTSKFNYFHSSNSYDLQCRKRLLFESDIDSSAENTILTVGCNKYVIQQNIDFYKSSLFNNFLLQIFVLGDELPITLA